MESDKGQSLNDPEKLLKLIKNGDAEMLLAEGDPGKGFNQLIQLDLISIEEGKILITSLGEEALEKGVEAVVSLDNKVPEVKPAITNTPVIKSKLNRKMWLLALLLLLFSLILLASQMLN